MKARGGLRRRSAWAVASESLDSLGTLVFSVWMAREVTAAEFGSYAIGFTIIQVALGLSSGAGSLTMMVRLGTADRRFTRDLAGAVTGVTAAVAVLPIAAFLGLAAVANGPLVTTCLAFAAIAPALLLQDCCIHLFYARQQQRKALLNNAVWFVLQVPLLILLPPLLAEDEAWSYVLSWGLAAYAAVAVSLVQLRTLPRPDFVPAWIREYRSTIGDLMLENTAGRMAMRTGDWVLGAVAGLRVFGGFRASQVFFGPTRVLNVGMAPMVLAEGVGLYERVPLRFMWLVRGWMALNAAMCLAIGAVLLALPESAGRAIAGDSWQYAEQVLIWTVVISVSDALLVPAQTGLRCLAATRLSATIHVAIAPLPALCTLMGGMLGGGYAAMMGLAAGMTLSMCTVAIASKRRFARPRRANVPSSGGRGRHNGLTLSASEAWPDAERILPNLNVLNLDKRANDSIAARLARRSDDDAEWSARGLARLPEDHQDTLAPYYAVLNVGRCRRSDLDVDGHASIRILRATLHLDVSGGRRPSVSG